MKKAGFSMEIDITDKPPENIPFLRWKFTRISLLFLGLILFSLILGCISIFSSTGRDELLQYTAFILFVASAFAFAYFAEKLLGVRSLDAKQQAKLKHIIRGNAEVADYCRKVAEQNRCLVVNEYEAIISHAEWQEEGE